MPASGHQDHTTSPYALARSSRAPSRPSHPASRFVTIAHTPLRSRRDAQREIIVGAVGEAVYFSRAGWTTQMGLNCLAKFGSSRTRFPAPLNPDERHGVCEIELICPTGKKIPRAAPSPVGWVELLRNPSSHRSNGITFNGRRDGFRKSSTHPTSYTTTATATNLILRRPRSGRREGWPQAGSASWLETPLTRLLTMRVLLLLRRDLPWRGWRIDEASRRKCAFAHPTRYTTTATNLILRRPPSGRLEGWPQAGSASSLETPLTRLLAMSVLLLLRR